MLSILPYRHGESRIGATQWHDGGMTSRKPRAVFIGLCTLDVIQSVDRVPSANEKIVAHDVSIAAGGPATNAAVAFAHLSGSATLVTQLPRHPLADLIRGDLEDCGVTLHAELAGDGPPVTAAIAVTRSTGDRSVVSPSSGASQLEATPAAPPPLDGINAVLVDGYHPHLAIATARAAQSSGIPVLMDAGSLKPHTADVVREVDMVIASASFATPAGSRAPEDVFEWLSEMGAKRAVITRGAEDVLWSTPVDSGAVPVPAVPVVDTLGAGDFFHGAMTSRIASQGMDDARLAEDIAWASRVVAPALASFGTRAWLRD